MQNIINISISNNRPVTTTTTTDPRVEEDTQKLLLSGKETGAEERGEENQSCIIENRSWTNTREKDTKSQTKRQNNEED